MSAGKGSADTRTPNKKARDKTLERLYGNKPNRDHSSKTGVLTSEKPGKYTITYK